jgi:hypothetical protein
MKNSLITLATVALLSSVNGFTVIGPKTRMSTQINLKDSIAEMIDKELERLAHKKEIEEQFNTKNKRALDAIIPTNYVANEDLEPFPPSVKFKDTKMALDNPQQYCADRCVSTGNCDVFEDMYHLSATEVMEFCTECVLSEEEEPCDVPDAMFDGLSP